MSILNDFKMDFFSLEGKVAIVTGGNTGLGQGYSAALSEAGADIFITVFDGDTEEIKNIIEKKGRRVHFLYGDLKDIAFREKVIEECLRVYGKIDILVNNAGMSKRNNVLDYKYEDWMQIIEVNLNAVYHLSQLAARVMVKQGSGKIINIASLLSYQGGFNNPAYATSKSGVAGITRAFSNELASKNVQVNAIAPGYMKSLLTAQMIEDEVRNHEVIVRIPAGRWGDTFDLMGAVVFLATRASDYVNGHLLVVDGGWMGR